MKNWMKLICLTLAAALLACALLACADEGDKSLLSDEAESTGTAAEETKETTASVQPTQPGEDRSISSLKLSKSGVTLRVGDSEQVTYIVTPSNADVSGLVWSVQDPAVATVENGKITGVGLGSTKVLLKSSDGVISVSIAVEVIEGDVKVIPPESLQLSQNVLVMKKGETASLTCTVGPENATDKTVNFVSDSSAVATVDQTGVVTAVAAGLTRIKATCGAVNAACLLIVKNDDGSMPSALTSTKTVQIGKTTELTYDVELFDGVSGLTLVSSDQTVVSLSGSTAKGEKVGTAEVTVRTADDVVLYIFKINVSEQPTNLPITGVRIDKGDNVTVEVGKTVKLTAILQPEGAVEARVEWINECETASGKPKYEGIYSLTKDGEITGLKVGKAPVTAYVKDPTTGKEFTRVCWVNVVEPGTQPPDDGNVKLVGISVVQSNFTMKVGESVVIEYNLIPANATNKNVDFVIEPVNGSRDYVKIDRATGTVTALRAVTGGKITVCTSDDNINKTVYITITD